MPVVILLVFLQNYALDSVGIRQLWWCTAINYMLQKAVLMMIGQVSRLWIVMTLMVVDLNYWRMDE